MLSDIVQKINKYKFKHPQREFSSIEDCDK